MKKLNVGCGSVYKDGWINLDCNTKIKADVYADITKKLPFDDSTIDYILADNVIEHLKIEDVQLLLREFNRILIPGGTLEIYVPHFTGILTKYLGHQKGYGVNSLCDEREIFNVVYEQLILISRCKTAGYQGLRFLNIFNFILNSFGRTWQQICEKFWPGGIEEIRFLMVAKKDNIGAK